MQIRNKKWKFVNIAALGFFALLFFFEFMPRYMSLFEQITNYISSVNEGNTLAQNIQELKLVKNENQRIKTNINQLISNYKENKNLSGILSYLDENAMASDIKFKEIKPGELKRQDNLWLQPIEVTLATKYENIYNYLRFIESSNKVILVNELTMEPVSDSRDSLNINIKFEVYLNL